MPGMVKVGKTTRDAGARAAELSAASGVPTPFVVLFERQFRDCDVGERQVHALLEVRGYRLSSNREFFTAPPSLVVDAVLEASMADAASGTEDLDQPSPNVRPYASMGESVMQEAYASLLGLGDALQDTRRARMLFKQAASVGVAEAYRELGELALSAGQEDRAIEHFMKGASAGDALCYGPMANIFSQNGAMENARKCWPRYIAAVIRQEPHRAPRECLRYIQECLDNGWPVEVVDGMVDLRDEMIEQLQMKGNVESSFAFVDVPLPVIRAKIVELFGDRPRTAPLRRSQWVVRTAEGKDFVAGTRDTVALWMNEGRIALDTFIWTPVEMRWVSPRELDSA